MGGLGTRGNRDLDGGSVGHMKRIFRRTRHVPGAILCLYQVSLIMTHRDRAGDAAGQRAGQRAGRREAAGDVGHRQGFPTPPPIRPLPVRPRDRRRFHKAFGRPMAFGRGAGLAMPGIAAPCAPGRKPWETVSMGHYQRDLVLLAAPALAEVTGRETVIDAPGTGQTCPCDDAPWDCGRPAAELLLELTAGKRVVCAERATGGGRPLEAKCKAAWLDLGAEPVSRRMPMPPHGRAARSGGRRSGRARIGRSKGAAVGRPGPRLPAPGPLVGRPSRT